jgi:hypothetical protein
MKPMFMWLASLVPLIFSSSISAVIESFSPMPLPTMALKTCAVAAAEGSMRPMRCASSITMRKSFWCIQALKPGLKLRSSMRWPWFSRIFE